MGDSPAVGSDRAVIATCQSLQRAVDHVMFYRNESATQQVRRDVLGCRVSEQHCAANRERGDAAERRDLDYIYEG